MTSLIVVSLIAGSAITAPAAAALTVEDFEQCLLGLINRDRIANGAGTLEMAYDLNPAVRAYSQKMAGEGDLRHMTSAERNPILPDSWNTWGENVAWHSVRNLPDCSTIHNMFMNSSGHRANILSSNKRFVSLGVYMGSNGTWVTELFFNASDYEAPGVPGDGLFWDDDISIFESDIETLAAAGITSGCNPPTNNRFCPNDHLTRGQMAAMLVRALDVTATNGTDFTDDNNSIFEPDIEKLSAAGITAGCNPPANDRYCPTRGLTRGQMAAMLVRALDLSSHDGTDFVDDNNSIFETDIERLATAGITAGCNPPANDRYCPDEKVTRGQMAAFLVRALGL
jgi:heat shock protein HslJ